MTGSAGSCRDRGRNKDKTRRKHNSATGGVNHWELAKQNSSFMLRWNLQSIRAINGSGCSNILFPKNQVTCEPVSVDAAPWFLHLRRLSAARLGFASLAVCGFHRSAFISLPKDPSVINRLMSQSEPFIFAANRKWEHPKPSRRRFPTFSSAEPHVLSLQVHDGSLTILGITRDDRGAYTCRAYSDQGEVLHTTRLLVQGTVIFPTSCCFPPAAGGRVSVFKAMRVHYL